ncbi:MAG: CRISPR-associated helicase Cas3' [Chloroflexi bacterium]|nr:CRISPR-associated helicase Cas3' [Chloroflexota bacterium]
MPLYPYQEHVKTLIQRGQSVVLQAPTGAGKTRAAMAPFIECFFEQPTGAFPRKCVYTVPMRVLANQFVQEYRESAQSYQRRFRRELKVQIQTGDQSQDIRFEGDLIFCTVDQFLSSYLTMPYSLPGRMANLNAGAMVGSYIVLDEFHLLDPSSTLPSVLYVIKQLRQLAPVLLMTATFSAAMLDNLAGELNAEVVLVSPEEARYIETRGGEKSPRQRTWHTADQALCAEAVLDMHHTRSLALCNTVQRAQLLYRELRRLIRERGLDTRLLLLHSRFLPTDRREIEDELKRLFGKDAPAQGNAIAVATQTIEVGLDITSEVLHTDLAPASALIQRAGRCARYPREQGQVVVYPVESYMPYGRANDDADKEDVWAREMKAAYAWLDRYSGTVFDFGQEQALVNAVATPRDAQVLKELSDGRRTRSADIQRFLSGDRQPGVDQRLLVRDADSRKVLIHAEPDDLLRNPYAATGFNLDLHTLFGMFKSWQTREADVEWRVKALVSSELDKEEGNRVEYGWKEINDSKLLAGVQVLVVHPGLAGYLKDEGFVADRGDTSFESALPPEAAAHTWDGLSYRLESYEDHIQRVLQAFQDIVVPELQQPACALERAAGWPDGSVLRAAWLACLCHDVGKLSAGWQGWARAYQKQIGRPVPGTFAAAHTDWEWGNASHRDAEKAIHTRHPKPNHAGEGALAMSVVLARALACEPLIRAVISAISRHHTPFAKECKVYTLEPLAIGHIKATLAFVPDEVRQAVDLKAIKPEVKLAPNSFSNLLVNPEHDFEWMAYVILARALRRADQEGTAKGTM